MSFSTLWMYVSTVLEVITLIISSFCFYILVKRYKLKRTKLSFYIIGFFSTLILLPIAQLLDNFLYPNIYPVRYGYAFFFLISAYANIMLLLFAFDTFLERVEQKGKSWIIYKIGVIIGETVVSIIGFILKIQDIDITLYIGTHFLIGFQLYILIIFRSYRLSTRIDDALYKTSIKSIAYLGMSFFGIYTCFIIDSFYTGYTPYGALGWVFFVITAISGYRGFVKPILKKKNHD